MLDLETLQHHVMLGAKNVWSMLAYDPSAPMLFSSGLFWLLFILILPVYVALKSSKSKMVFFIVLFSLYFYYKSSGLFFLMLIGTSWVDWLISVRISHAATTGHSKEWMWLSIIL